MGRWTTAAALMAALLVTCTSGDEAPGYEPERFCPGQPGCRTAGETLEVGAAKVTITPVINGLTEHVTVDVDMDGEFDPHEDEFNDANGNGKFDGEWIAGFGHGRAATGVHDDQWARAIALRSGDTTVVVVALDVVGYFWDEIEKIRGAVKGEDIDYIAIGSTHTHEARDTIGIWGVSEGESGLDQEYMAHVRIRTAEAIRSAVMALEPSKITYASLKTRDLPGGMLNYQSDARDPYIIDDELRIMKFTAKRDNRTIATLLNWGSHPEYTGDENTLLSSDYPHFLREGVEAGVEGPDGNTKAGIGGVAVFFAGALGSQIGPGHAHPHTWADVPVQRNSFDSSGTVGGHLAYHVLEAIDGGTTDDSAAIGFAAQPFFVDVQNRGYHTALLQELFDRKAYNWDDNRPLIPGENEPDIRTEVALIDIGRAQIICMPGEVDPALFLGGYDGSHTPETKALVDETLTNPPDLSRAPGGPYLRDLARPDAEFVYLFGLTNDMLGYFVPEFDYELHPHNPYFDEADGDHYEETNSVGIDGWPTIRGQVEQLLRWRAENAGRQR